MGALSLYRLADEYRADLERLADLDLPPEVVADTLASLGGELEHKAVAVAQFSRNLQVTAEAIRQAELEMAERRRVLEARAARLRDYLRDCMELAGVESIESPHFRLSIKTNPPAVVVDDERQVPPQFMRYPEPPEPRPDRAAIKAALLSGEDVPGCRLERTKRLGVE